jgi:hypothetical protein
MAEGYQIVWWFMVGLYVQVAIVVVLVGGPKRLVTAIGKGGVQMRLQDHHGEFGVRPFRHMLIN